MTAEDEPFDTEMSHWLGRDLRRANNAVLRHFSEEFDQYKIRPALYAVMTMIDRFPGSSGAKLSELLRVPRANMVLIVRELEGRALINRTASENSKRSHAFYLTSSGKDLLQKLRQAHDRHEKYINGKLTEAERNFLIAILRKLWMED